MPQRITDDAVADTDPSVVGIPGSGFLATWLQGDTYVELLDWDTGAFSVIAEGAGAEMASATLAAEDAGDTYLFWTGQTSDGPDIVYRVRPGVDGRWGQEAQLTHDEVLKQYLSAVASGDGAIHLLYSKAETVLEQLTVDTPEGSITIDDVPQPGRSDLYGLTHIPGADLAIALGDVWMSEPNPAPGQEVTLSAKACCATSWPMRTERSPRATRTTTPGATWWSSLEAEECCSLSASAQPSTWPLGTIGRSSPMPSISLETVVGRPPGRVPW